MECQDQGYLHEKIDRNINFNAFTTSLTVREFLTENDEKWIKDATHSRYEKVKDSNNFLFKVSFDRGRVAYRYWKVFFYPSKHKECF